MSSRHTGLEKKPILVVMLRRGVVMGMGVLKAQPSSLASHIHRMVKDEDNRLENKGSSSFLFLFLVFSCCLLSFFFFFLVAAGVGGWVVWNLLGPSLSCKFRAVP